MVVWILIVMIVYLFFSATETSSKMTSKLCQKWFRKPRFFVKKLNFFFCSLDHMILFKFHMHVVQGMYMGRLWIYNFRKKYT